MMTIEDNGVWVAYRLMPGRTVLTPLLAYKRTDWIPRIDDRSLFAPGLKLRLITAR
jgi:hypothetical protein